MRRVSCFIVLIMSVMFSLVMISIPSQASVSTNFLKPPREAVPGQYIVVLKNTTSASNVNSLSQSLVPKNRILATYHTALKGFSARLTEKQARKLAKNANVDFIQQDGLVHSSTVQNIPAPPNSYWGLNRIDQRARPGNLPGKYNYVSTGAGIRAYVLDTGIQTTHAQFGSPSRAVSVFTATGLPMTGVDCYGHGTHVAGIIGGSVYGVAKKVYLRSVKVLDCNGSGTFSQVIEGVDYVTAHHISPAIANMSLGGGAFLALDIAVNNSIESGVTYSLAAGNSSADACNTSPARTLSAITVGATGNYANPSLPISDARSSYSNYGSCLDLFAPGTYIKSACSNIYNLVLPCAGTINHGFATISGTSMAAPHVAGVSALILQRQPTWNPLQVRNYLVNRTTKNLVTDSGPGSPNKLLYSAL